MVSTEIWSSTTVLNIANIRKCFFNSKSSY